MEPDVFLDRLERLKRYAAHGRRAPHKPLLLLFALGRFKHADAATIRFSDADAVLPSLLRTYGSPGTRARTLDPFGRLETDGIWLLQGEREDLYDRGGNLRQGVLESRNVCAGFSSEVLELLHRRPDLIDVAARRLLDANFPPDLHEDVLAGIGLRLGTTAPARRDPQFRRRVLDAYLHACAACGFSLRHGDALLGIDAAHIRWHAFQGPNEVPNGIAFCTLHHKLFDLGAITVGLDRRLQVAHGVNGASARRLFDELHGRPLDLPPDPGTRPFEAHLRWHHEQVFRGSVPHPPC